MRICKASIKGIVQDPPSNAMYSDITPRSPADRRMLLSKSTCRKHRSSWAGLREIDLTHCRLWLSGASVDSFVAGPRHMIATIPTMSLT